MGKAVTNLLTLTPAEVDWLISAAPSSEYGTDFRARLFAARILGIEEENNLFLLGVDLDTLWAIDSVIQMNEPFANKLMSGTPLLGLAEKIWREIAIAEGKYEERVTSTDTYKDACEVANAPGEGEAIS